MKIVTLDAGTVVSVLDNAEIVITNKIPLRKTMHLLPALIRSQVSSTVRHILDINAHYRL